MINSEMFKNKEHVHTDVKSPTVIHTVSSIADNMGGPSIFIKSLCENLAIRGLKIIVCTQNDKDVSGESVNIEKDLVGIKYIPYKKILHHLFELIDFKKILSENNFDLVHSHGLWSGANIASSIIARKQNIGHLITIHGMLKPRALCQSRWKKKLAGWICQNKSLHDAVCLHATALQEYESIRIYGLTNPVAIIPIGIEVQDYSCDLDRSQIDMRWPEVQGKHILLFLSRIHPIKGLLNLIKAWSRLKKIHRDWHLIIAGPDEDNHLVQVQMLINKTGVLNSVTFTGPVYGDLKKNLYAACDVFVLPTFSENFGIVIPEALASGKPVITTKGTPWQELQTYRCGWWIDIGIEPLEAAMKEALNLSDKQRQEMGLRGRKLIEKNYSWPQIAVEMVDVYKWILGQGNKPDCVRLD
jgi:glycosyltransferase involved in cell wall biosynthesis